MLWTSTLVLYLHIISFMLTYAAVAAEYALLRGSPDPPTIRALGAADAVYAGAAVGVFATGVLQTLYLGKGLAYYLQSPILWSKVGLFTLVGSPPSTPPSRFCGGRPSSTRRRCRSQTCWGGPSRRPRRRACARSAGSWSGSSAC